MTYCNVYVLIPKHNVSSPHHEKTEVVNTGRVVADT